MELATGGAGLTASVRRAKNNKHSKVEACALNLVALADNMNQQAQEYIALIKKAEIIISKLDRTRYRQVLELRYLCGMPWAQITAEMGYSDRKSAYRVHGWALLEAEKHLKNGY